MSFRFLFFVFLLLPFPVFGAGVVLNEVMFDPAGTDTGLEWVELYNAGDAPQDFSGWQLYPDGIGYFTFPQGFMLAAKQFLVVHLRTSGANSATDLYHSAASGNMGNTSGSVALFSKEPRGKDTLQSFIQWGRGGETWESDASDAVIWTKGTFVDVSGFAEGKSIGLSADGVASGGAGAWRIIASPTPGGGNGGSAVLGSSPAPITPIQSSASPSASAQSSVATLPFPTLLAEAGSDITVAAGSLVEFTGAAILDGKPLIDGTRFWWNFGDGASREGRVVSHTFTIPGIYTVGLHVSNIIYAASDYLAVTVLPSAVSLPQAVSGREGFVVIRNSSVATLDIGEWILEDGAGKRFVIPSRTKIGVGLESAFPNAVTGLLGAASSTPFVVLAYPNGVRAAVFENTTAIASVAPASPLVGKEGKKGVSSPAISEVAQKFSLSTLTAEGVPAGTQETAALAREQTPTEDIGGLAALPFASPPSLFLAAAALMSVCGAFGFLLVRRRM